MQVRCHYCGDFFDHKDSHRWPAAIGMIGSQAVSSIVDICPSCFRSYYKPFLYVIGIALFLLFLLVSSVFAWAIFNAWIGRQV